MAIAEIRTTLEGLRRKGEVVAYSLRGADRQPTVQLSLIGKAPSKEVAEFLERKDIVVAPSIMQPERYSFLGELRPGTGIIRRVGGRPEGPNGTLTCFLSSRDSQDLYFAAAGHVATNFWKIAPPDADGSIYLSRKGFPGTNSMRFLGELFYSSAPPRRMDPYKPEFGKEDPDKDKDIAVVKLEGGFDAKQRTTCYGHFGEWPSEPVDVKEWDPVMKCGAEETHWTAAVVECVGQRVWVYGPDKAIYELENQVILKLPTPPKPLAQQSNSPTLQCRTPLRTGPAALSAQQEQTLVQQSEPPKVLPNNSSDTPFGVAGDSGTMVIHQETRRPVGMLIAGSILDGKYVMTPISTIYKYWTKLNLVLLRA